MRAVVAIGRVGHVTAAVAHARGHHAVHLAQQLLHAPEAAAGKDRLLVRHHAPPVLAFAGAASAERYARGSSTCPIYSPYPAASTSSPGTNPSAAEMLQAPHPPIPQPEQ